jgi:hypothetical protein
MWILLHHQPTPGAVQNAERKANADADAALQRAPSRVARPSTKQSTIGSFPLKLGIRCKEFGSAPYIGFEDPKAQKT